MCPITYLPVLKGKKSCWWNHNAPFKYPYAFASYVQHQLFKNLRQEFGFDSDVLLFTDSGGYSILTRNLTIDPYEYASWINKSGVDAAMILDFPPYSDPYKSAVIEFDKKLELTIRAAKILIDRVKSSVQLYAAIHGIDHRQYEIWRQSLELVGDFQGYAFGVAPVNDPRSVLNLIRYLESIKNEKPVHFFETGDAVPFLLLSRYAKRRGLFTTVDSSYAVTSSANYRYCTVFGLRLVPIGPKTKKLLSFKSSIPDCICPVCQRYGIETVARDPEIMLLHNLYLLIWRYKFINSVSLEKPESLKLILPEAVNYVKQLDDILERRGGLLDYV